VTPVLGYLTGTFLVGAILPLVTRRTQSDLDDELLAKVGSHIR
jgi:hypothetical protein